MSGRGQRGTHSRSARADHADVRERRVGPDVDCAPMLKREKKTRRRGSEKVLRENRRFTTALSDGRTLVADVREMETSVIAPAAEMKIAPPLCGAPRGPALRTSGQSRRETKRQGREARRTKVAVLLSKTQPVTEPPTPNHSDPPDCGRTSRTAILNVSPLGGSGAARFAAKRQGVAARSRRRFRRTRSSSGGHCLRRQSPRHTSPRSSLL